MFYHNKRLMLQQFINKNFYRLLVFTLVFGVIFYDTIGFNLTDEICSFLLLVLYLIYVFSTKRWEFNKLFLITTGVFLFYMIYSLVIGSNTKKAILTDFIIQYKPYLAFFCVYAIKPVLNQGQKIILRQTCVVFSFYLLILGLISLAYPSIMNVVMGHVSRYATAVSVLAVLYLYCGNFSPREKLVFLLLLAIGIISGRSKFYGFYAICLGMMVYMNASFQMKFNLKNNLFILFTLFFVLVVAREKIILYFVEGGFGESRSTNDLYARMALYYFAFQVFTDFFPLGSGFASYATYASGSYYSKLYSYYGMDGLHGLTKANPKFIADTYYPALAQFGVVGVLLFFLFWARLGIQAIKAYEFGCKKESILALIIIIFFLIECTSDATLTHNRGVFMMMLLGLVFSDIKQKKEQWFSERTTSLQQ